MLFPLLGFEMLMITTGFIVLCGLALGAVIGVIAVWLRHGSARSVAVDALVGGAGALAACSVFVWIPWPADLQAALFDPAVRAFLQQVPYPTSTCVALSALPPLYRETRRFVWRRDV